MKPLIVVTTFNQIAMTRHTADWFTELGHDLLYVDDCSTDGTQQYLAEIKVNAILKEERKGLTDSWNLAYNYWKGSQHSHLVICNNDILMPKGCVENLMSHHTLTVPMCNFQGAGYACKAQGKKGVNNDPQGVQDSLQKHKGAFERLSCWTGFCMCFSHKIVKYELDNGNLLPPELVNVGNDDYLAKKMNAYLALGSYVHHYKGQSFGGQVADRDNLNKTY